MLENFNNQNGFQYKRLTEEEQKRRGILGRLVGPIADFINPTRNGRKYSDELWEKVFDNPIMKEKIENRVCLGELGHPEGRQETDIEKVAICLAEVPKKDKKTGKLFGVFDILSTPNGRILKSLCDYGCKIGISSRGSGDIMTDVDGQESVDPDTYDCECWDAVLLPAVKDARLTYVTESLDKTRYNKSLRSVLQESIINANENDRKVMKETLEDLGIDLDNNENSINDINDKSLNIEEDQEELAVDNNEAKILDNLQESLIKNRELEQKVIDLQEKLSVSYTKENELVESNNKMKVVISRLSKNSSKVKALNEKIQSLENQITEQQTKIEKSNQTAYRSKERNSNMLKDLRSLLEAVKERDEKIEKLSRSLQESISKNDREKKVLTEKLNTSNKTNEQKLNECLSKVEKLNKLVEKYKKAANDASRRYIKSKALMIGVSENEILNRLSESYTFDEVDEICESLRDYKLTLNKLPFRPTINESMKFNVKQSTKESILPDKQFDDDVDSQLLSIAGLQN